MKVLPLHKDIKKYLTTRNLKKKFEKQITLFQLNPFHTSLNTEILEPREMKIWSFRIDMKFRAIFIFHGNDTVEIIDVNNHYR